MSGSASGNAAISPALLQMLLAIEPLCLKRGKPAHRYEYLRISIMPIEKPVRICPKCKKEIKEVFKSYQQIYSKNDQRKGGKIFLECGCSPPAKGKS